MKQSNTIISITPPALFIILCGLCLCLFTSNPLLTVVSLTELVIIIKMLFRKNEPPVLLFAVLFQWIQVTTKIFHADILGINVTEFFGHQEIDSAIWLSLLGLLILSSGISLGILLGIRHTISSETTDIQTEVMHFSFKRLWISYLLSTVASFVLIGLIWEIPQLTQILVALLSIKWVFFALLAYTILARKEKYKYLYISVTLEVLMGFTGYFSGFKLVFFMLFIVYLTREYHLTIRNIIRISAAVITVAFLVMIWTGVKGAYRAYLNEGTGQQTVSQSINYRIKKLITLASGIKKADIPDVINSIATRTAYVDMFAYVLRRVPETVPHENGNLWIKSVLHIFVPRLFFPEKPILESDSELTMKYTGLRLASDTQGTSISMGYMAENYIDFGMLGMFIPVFVLGMIWGKMYKAIITYPHAKVFNYSLAIPTLIYIYPFETAGIKLFGGTVTRFLVAMLILKYLSSPICRWLVEKK